jgi:cell division protein FtsB
VVPLLTKGIQEQQAQIAAQQAEINELKALVKQLLEKK